MCIRDRPTLTFASAAKAVAAAMPAAERASVVRIAFLMEIVDTQGQAEALAVSPLIVREPLQDYLDSEGIGAGPLGAERIGEGHSNITYRIDRGGESVVLRRPPRPPLPPSAHDVLREARLLSALEGAHARTPRVLAACNDEEVLGVPFYVMEYVEGTVVTSAMPPALDSPEERRRACEELVDGLVEVHAVDWRAAGLEGFAKPTGYLERQLRRFNGLWEHNKTRELPIVAQVADWLASNLPESPAATIVHGDYRLGNVMAGPDSPGRVVAVFDWELATISSREGKPGSRVTADSLLNIVSAGSSRPTHVTVR